MPPAPAFDLGPGSVAVTGARRDLAGIATLDRVWLGTGTPRLEVGLLSAEQALPPGRMRTAWTARRAGRAVPVILVLPLGELCRVCGPEGEPPPVRDLPFDVVVTLLRRSLGFAPDVVVEALRAELARGSGSGGVPGLRNDRLMSTHYLVDVLPTRPEWGDLCRAGAPALRKENRDFPAALGYELQATGPDELVLRSRDEPLAVAHLYRGAHQFDRIIETVGVPAGSHVLSRAAQQGAHFGLLISGPIVRVLSRETSGMLGESVASAAFLEVATDILPDARSGVIGACYAPAALGRGGFARVREQSARYAVGLRERFRDRVYEEVVPSLVRGIAAAARAASVAASPSLLYRATMLTLFRTLFVLYAEDRNLLPVDHPEYRLHSLTSRIPGLRQSAAAGRFEARATSLWTDMRQIFAAVAGGHREWGVPAYDGGLFVDDPTTSEEGAFLASIQLSNEYFGPALHGLAVDTAGDDSGKVDFGALGVRHIGNLYEGLLSYEVAVAEDDLAIDETDPIRPYLKAQKGDKVAVRSGEPYMRSPRGGRKASGSYYTPEFIVDRVVGGSVAPAFDRHLAAVRTLDPAERAERVWDFRVCDPAMGSGHFLVSVIDDLAERLERALPDLPTVAEEMERARAAVRHATATAGAAEIAEVKDIDLLRRLVLKRCVYGVDLNPMAVELARLGMWLHAFVPGLPLSYLGHTLRRGNSLVGIVGDEIGGLLERQPTLYGNALRAHVEAALEPAREIARLGDLELHEIERSRERQRDLEAVAAEVIAPFELFTAAPLVEGSDVRLHHDQLVELLDQRATPEMERLLPPSREVCRSLAAFHWVLAFPEVFLRDRPGFDAVVANPPWEEVTVEELGFWGRYLPRLHSESSGARQRELIREFAARHPEIGRSFDEAKAEAELMRRYLGASFTLTRSGDPDLYKAFAERFLSLVRGGGVLGVVLPRSAFAADGTKPFRELLFARAGAVRLDFLLNRGGWVFEDVHPQYTIALLAAEIAPEREMNLSVAGPADRPEAFARIDEARTTWTGDELRAADFTVPLLPDPAAAALFRHCYAVAPRFDAPVGDWRAVPWRELDVTNDRKSGLLREGGNGWPVYTGGSFDLWQPDLDKPPFVIPQKKGLAELQRKRQRSSVWREHYPARVLADESTLPQHRARILFRDIARSSDSRTVRACLVPPRIFAVNTAPSLVFPRGEEPAQAYVLAVLCSLPFDWLARRRVEIHLNFFILNALPMPRPDRTDPLRTRAAALAARLACADGRFADFAAATGVESGPLAEPERVDTIAELDALVARLYRLDAAQLEIIFSDFTSDAVPESRRAAVRRHYARLDAP